MNARMFPTLSNTSISSKPNWTKPSVSFQHDASSMIILKLLIKAVRVINQKILRKSNKTWVDPPLMLTFLQLAPEKFTFSDFSTKFLNKVLFIFFLPWLVLPSTVLSSSMLTLMSWSLSITWNMTLFFFQGGSNFCSKKFHRKF